MTGQWNPDTYKDDYKEALMEVIEEKVVAGGKAMTKAKKAKPVKATNVIDLVTVLQQSIQKHGYQRATNAANPKPKRKAA